MNVHIYISHVHHKIYTYIIISFSTQLQLSYHVSCSTRNSTNSNKLAVASTTSAASQGKVRDHLSWPLPTVDYNYHQPLSTQQYKLLIACFSLITVRSKNETNACRLAVVAACCCGAAIYHQQLFASLLVVLKRNQRAIDKACYIVIRSNNYGGHIN